MSVPSTIEAQLTRDEGLRLYPYYDGTGNLTIGVGHNLTANGISDSVADLILQQDINKACHDLGNALPWVANLDRIRYWALVNLTFNMGIRGLLSFGKMLAAIQSRDWQTAASELLSSEFASQVGPRAQRLAMQLTTGEWQ